MPLCDWAKPRTTRSRSGPRARRGAFRLACALALVTAQAAFAENEVCDSACLDRGRDSLVGDWYVLVHYRDVTREEDETATDWEDQVWRVEASGENLRWTIFPHVEFSRARGRYEEKESGGVRARSTGAWSPDAEQLEEVRDGLELDPYSSRSKTLRGSGREGWQSSGTLRSESASMLGYHELWRIDLSESGPVFSRRDSMGSARTDRLEGRTTWTADPLNLESGDVSGDFARGSRFRGRFRMIRMGGSERPESGS